MNPVLKTVSILFAITAGVVGLLAFMVWSKMPPTIRPPHLQASGWVIEKGSNRVRPDAVVEIWRKRYTRSGPEPDDTLTTTALVETLTPDSGYYRYAYQPAVGELFVAKAKTPDGKAGKMILLAAVDSADSPFVANLPID